MPDEGAEGVLINQGGVTGGWSLYLKDGKPTYTASFFGREFSTAAAAQPLAAGEHQVSMEFAYDGGGLGKGGTATLYIDGEQVADARVERTHITLYTFDETTDVGRDTGARSPPTTRPATTPSPARSSGSDRPRRRQPRPPHPRRDPLRRRHDPPVELHTPKILGLRTATRHGSLRSHDHPDITLAPPPRGRAGSGHRGRAGGGRRRHRRRARDIARP